jgi:hypothetical protein
VPVHIQYPSRPGPAMYCTTAASRPRCWYALLVYPKMQRVHHRDLTAGADLHPFLERSEPGRCCFSGNEPFLGLLSRIRRNHVGRPQPKGERSRSQTATSRRLSFSHNTSAYLGLVASMAKRSTPWQTVSIEGGTKFSHQKQRGGSTRVQCGTMAQYNRR